MTETQTEKLAGKDCLRLALSNYLFGETAEPSNGNVIWDLGSAQVAIPVAL
jgi:hypothetical protein